MRNLTLGIVVLGLAGAGGLAAFASNHAGRSACWSASSTAAKRSCSPSSAAGTAACDAPSGNIAGHFDPAMTGVCRFACATKLEYDATQVLAQPGAKPGMLAQCPVSGVVFMVDATRPRVRIAGNEYATCCDRCATKLERDPHHYLRI